MLIKLDLIKPPAIPMREVDTFSIDYMTMRDSMRPRNQLSSILVRPVETGYEVVDGMHRLTAAHELGWPDIECSIKDMTPREALVATLQSNAVRAETKRVEYAKHLIRIQRAYPELTLAQLAQLCGRQPYWVRQQLNLLDLRLEYQTMVDQGLIPTLNAYELARLSHSRQGYFLTAAMTLSAEEFPEYVATEVRRLMVASQDRKSLQRLGSDDTPPRLRSLKNVMAELRKPTVVNGLIAECKPKTLQEAFLLGLQWATSTDALTVEERKDKLARLREKNNEQ